MGLPNKISFSDNYYYCNKLGYLIQIGFIMDGNNFCYIDERHIKETKLLLKYFLRNNFKFYFCNPITDCNPFDHKKYYSPNKTKWHSTSFNLNSFHISNIDVYLKALLQQKFHYMFNELDIDIIDLIIEYQCAFNVSDIDMFERIDRYVLDSGSGYIDRNGRMNFDHEEFIIVFFQSLKRNIALHKIMR